MRRNATLKGRCVRKEKEEKRKVKKKKRVSNEKNETRVQYRRPYHVEYAEVITECD